HVAVVALEVAHQAAGLHDQQRAGGDVPGREAEFPESVQPPGGHVGEVERGGARASHPRRLLHHLAQDREIAIDVLELTEGKARADERIAHPRAPRYANALLVEVRAAAATG